MKRRTFLELYLPYKYFADEANKNIGKAGISTEVLMARRNVTNRLTAKGQEVMNDILNRLNKVINGNAKAKWDIYCGCSCPCPCSPGFRVSADFTNEQIPERYPSLKGDNRFILFVNEDGTYNLRLPRVAYFFDIKLLEALSKEFSK